MSAPALQLGGLKAMVEKIFQHAEQQRSPEYPPATEPVFGKADPELTKQLVPQTSIAGKLPQLPDASEQLPFKDRSRGILENTPEIGRELANDLLAAGMGGTASASNAPFYSTGSVLLGLTDRAGLSPQESIDFMRNWSGQGAATSPRTKTPANLRNASYLLFRNAQGDPFTTEKFDTEGNRPGFPMIGGMHLPLSSQFFAGTADPLQNSKPFTFRENWSGNMADVTVDTHNVRKILDVYDRLFPGTLSRQWFNSDDAFKTYQEGGGFPKEGLLPVGDIHDKVGFSRVGGQKSQTEYPILQGPTKEAARLLDISPAEAQERLWFQGGSRTNLQSPQMTIPDLLNAQIEKTAKVLGVPPEAVLKLWARHAIPLAEADVGDVPGAEATG
jgi:hypothetical protein